MRCFSPVTTLVLKEVIGKSMEGSWQEIGWAIGGLAREEAVEIGRHFSQRAIFELTNDKVCVIPLDGDAREALPRVL